MIENIKIIFEDDDILVINKPAGLLVHRAKNTDPNEKTLADWILEKHPEINGVGEDENRPGIVHRLDKDTSGILLIAKNQKSYEYLKKQFQERKIQKTYIALVCGRPKDKRGVINLEIGKSKTDFRKKTTQGKMVGLLREAITEYEVMEYFDDYTLMKVYPKTGRTHQIRVHMKSIGNPIACDKLYGFKNSKCPDFLNRHFLHALGISLTLFDGSKTTFEVDLPENLEKMLSILRVKV